VLTGYFGPEVGGASTTWRNLVDLVVAHTMGPLGLNFNFDWINQSDVAPWQNYFGFALMARYAVNDHLALAVRGEYAHPTAVVGGPKTNLFEGTLTAAFPVGGHMEFRAELRGDGASGNGIHDFDGGQDTSVITGTGAFMAWF